MTQLREATFITLFPEMVQAVTQTSILGRATGTGLLTVHVEQIRDHGIGSYKAVDDTPYGGGPGQVLRVDVVVSAIRAVEQRCSGVKPTIVFADPAAKPFTQADAVRLSGHEHLVFVCGRYEGVDARVYHYVDEAFSVGDYVLTGGELPSLVMFDAIARHIPGVLGNEASSISESFSDDLLEHSQYTRPSIYEGHAVPEVLKNGNHAHILAARTRERRIRTKLVRPDLCTNDKAACDDRDLQLLSQEMYPWKK